MNILEKIVNLSIHKKELLKGSLQTIVLKIAGLLTGYIFIMILSRNYGAHAVGVYQIFIQAISIVGMIALFGFNQSIIRFSAELISKKNIKELIYILKKFTFITYIVSIILSLLLYSYSYKLASLFLKDESMGYIFDTIALTLPFFSINILFVETIRGFKKIKVSEFLRLFFTRFITLILFLLMIFFIPFTLFMPIVSFSFATVLTFILSTFFIIKYINIYIKENKIGNGYETIERKYISTSFTMYQSILSIMISNQIVIFILAYYTKPEDVGIYNIAFQLAALTTFVFGSIMSITAPKYAELYHADSKEYFYETVKFSSKLIFWTSGSLSVFTIIFSSFLMGMFGEEFIVGYSILVVLSVGNFINAFTGPGGFLLDMTGHQTIRRNITLLGVIVTIPLSFLIIPIYGGLGLALVLLINKIVGNFISVYYVKKHLNVNLLYIPLWTR